MNLDYLELVGMGNTFLFWRHWRRRLLTFIAHSDTLIENNNTILFMFYIYKYYNKIIIIYFKNKLLWFRIIKINKKYN